MIEDLRAYLATRFEGLTYETLVAPGGDDAWKAPNFGTAGGTRIAVLLNLPLPDVTGTAAMRRKGTTVSFVGQVYVSILLPNDPALTAGLRRYGFAWSWGQWRGLGIEDFKQIADELTRRRDRAIAGNEELAMRYRGNPISQDAARQVAREAAILAELPTAEVDAWIIANMGYTADELAGLARTTRRDRRREARQQMRAR